MKAVLYFILLFFHITVLVSSDTSCPSRCTCRIRSVPKHGKIYFVNCRRKGLTKVPDLSALKGNVLPKRLDLAGNSIKSISRDDFPTGLNIAMLFLEYNKNVMLRNESLMNLADSLQFLDIKRINLMFVSPFTFLRGLSQLEKLILDENYQRDDVIISTNLFKNLGLASMKEISMYNCRIGGMEEGVFVGIEHLQELVLTFNWLKEVPAAIKDLHSLKKINLKLNNIKMIASGSFQGMRSLDELILDDNDGLEVASESLAGLENSLTSISMRNCELDDVPYEGLWNLMKLETLNIGYNPLLDMSPTSLNGSYCLKTLDISKTFFPLNHSILEPQKTCITNLLIDDRNLTDVPTEFMMILTNLNHVSLTKNQITALKPGSLRGIKSRGYDLSNNPLKIIEKGAFNGTGRGITLGLKLTNLTDMLFVLDYPENTFRGLYFEGTNITCDCLLYKAMTLCDPRPLDGHCVIRGDTKDLKDPKFKSFLKSNCTGPDEEQNTKNTGRDEEQNTKETGPDVEETTKNTGTDEDQNTKNTGSDEEQNTKNTGPDEEQKTKTTGPDVEQTTKNTGPDEEQNAKNTGPHEEQNTKTTGPDVEQTRKTTRPDEEQNTKTTGPDEEQNTKNTGPDVEQTTKNTGPDEEQNTKNTGSDVEQTTKNTGPDEEQNTKMSVDSLNYGSGGSSLSDKVFFLMMACISFMYL